MKGKIIVDTTVLTNFTLINREDILMKVFEDGIFTTREVMKELQQGEKRGVFPKRNWNWVKVLQVETDQEQHTFELLKQRLGAGEASCLSLAVNRLLKFLTDDRDARKNAQRRGVPVSGTIGILIIAIKKSIISLENGNRILFKMIENGYYSPYNALNELL